MKGERENMKRKHILSLLLVLALVCALFAGCAQTPAANGTEQTPASSANEGEPTEQTPAETTPEETAPAETEPAETEPAETEPVEEDTGLKLAAGKVTWENNWPTSGYDYETPFCTTGETLTYWTTCWTPALLPEEGLDGIDFCIEEQKRTGVDIEYLAISYESRAESFATLLASDDLPDLMNQADIYYPGTEAEAIAEAHFANIYDYKEYAPNYLYYIHEHMDEDKNLYDQCFLNDTTITKFYGLNDRGGLDATTIAIRADWLEKLGVELDSVDTIDELEQLSEQFRSEFGASYPLNLLYEGLDTDKYLGCFDTYTGLSTSYVNAYPSPRVEDGQVIFYFSDERAHTYVDRISTWVAKGYVSPNWLNSTDAENNTNTGLTGISVMPANSTASYNAMNVDPDCDWQIIKKPSLYEGQVHHLGVSKGLCNGFGRTQISAACENIPLAVSWCDWRYCPEGSELSAWGVEGTLWEYDAEGNRVATEWAYNNPEGQLFGFLECLYSSNFLAEHGLGDATAPYSYPGGNLAIEAFDRWYDFEYDGAYEWPKGILLDEDQSNEFMRYADMDTYICENITAFVANGGVSQTEWEQYIAGLEAMGLHEAEAIYQEAYDAYAARAAARNA